MKQPNPQMIFVKPNEGARIRQPNRNNQVMPDTGDFVSMDDTYYNRLIGSGDLLVIDAPSKVDRKEEPHRSPKPRE